MPRVIMRQYPVPPHQGRLAVGDIIRCPAFQIGLRLDHQPDEVVVAWRNRLYPEYHARSGNGIQADDESRAYASFLVMSVGLAEGVGPDDVCPGEHRLSREVMCVRLSAEMWFSSESERIRFSLDEPMSVAQPDVESILVLGYAELPIIWNE